MFNSKNALILPAKITDGVEILEMQKLAFEGQAKFYNRSNIPSLRESVKEIEKEIGSRVFLKAVYNDQIIGAIRGTKKDNIFWIERLFVIPKYQNQGIGKLLTTTIEQIPQDIEYFQLYTGHKSKRNLHLYKSLGYTIFKKEVINDDLTTIFLRKK